MNTSEIRSRYLRFFESRGHAVIPSAYLVPENDPTTLFTGSGMQPLLPYLLGETHPQGTRLTDSQKCFRSGDIEEVGDNRHTTFFEMLGNWSLGDYFKKEQLSWFWTFLTEEVKLDPQRIYVTCYIGNSDAGIPKDTESAAIWKALFLEKGIDAKEMDIGDESRGYEIGERDGRIFYYTDKNWWSRSGGPSNMPKGEPGGPDSEVFYLFPSVEHDKTWGEHCHPNCDCGRYIELGNSVFMQYLKTEEGFAPLPNQNVDYGGGLERIVAAANDSSDVFPFAHAPILSYLEKVSGKSYQGNERAFRIIADHMKAAVFLIADGVTPSNADQGYFVRRLIRRSVRYADILGIGQDSFANIVRPVADMYCDVYPNIATKALDIEGLISEEEARFRTTLERGLKEFQKIATDSVSGHDAFILFTTYGFPYELTEELAKEKGKTIDRAGYEAEMAKHQETSRAGAEHKFKGGLADHSEKVVQYHTATHLLLAGLRRELGEHVHQAGSNITGERLRFDFTHGEKVTPDILKRVEQFVNDAIKDGAYVTTEIMSKDSASKDTTIEGSFWEKYPDEVKVYTIKSGTGSIIYSRELCGGPHVENTSHMGTFKIQKEEAVAAGVRRIKAVLEEKGTKDLFLPHDPL